jgi:5'-nucleotidase
MPTMHIKEERRRILLDVDGVLADFTHMLLNWTNNEYAEAYTDADIIEFNCFKALGIPSAWPAFNAHVSKVGVCYGIPVREGAQAFVNSLRKFADVVIVTSLYTGAPFWINERIEWLEDHFEIDAKDVVFTGRKELVAGDLLIDDALHNVGRNHYARSILIDQPWNNDPEPPPKRYYMRARDLDHALALARHSFGVLPSEG